LGHKNGTFTESEVIRIDVAVILLAKHMDLHKAIIPFSHKGRRGVKFPLPFWERVRARV